MSLKNRIIPKMEKFELCVGCYCVPSEAASASDFFINIDKDPSLDFYRKVFDSINTYYLRILKNDADESLVEFTKIDLSILPFALWVNPKFLRPVS